MNRKMVLASVLTMILAIGLLLAPMSAFAADSDYPISTDQTLTYWKELNPHLVAPNFSSFNDTEFAKYLDEETGIHVDYISPPVGQAPEAFSLLVATGDMPDIIEYGWAKQTDGYPGGVQAAIDNGVIIPLNDLIDEYAPDLKAILEANPNYDKMIKTDEGLYYIFPVMKLDNFLNTTAGLVVRYDWLDKLSMEIPVTIEDWYNMLTGFKNELGAEYPLTFAGYNYFKIHMGYGELIGAYGVNMSWFQQDQKAVFGPYEPGYKDWLIEMAKWYKEGLIDPNFATNDVASADSNIFNNISGATSLWLGSGLGKYLPELRSDDPNATLGPVPYPVLNEGDVPQFSSLLNPYDGYGACITTSCKNPELVAQFLNYGYTQAGRLTYNFGREGISYSFDSDGQVQLTEAITDNEDGWAMGPAWSKYAHGVYPGPYFSERRFLELYYPYPEQVQGLEYFSSTNMSEHLLPPMTPTSEEADRFSRIMTDVQALVDEYTLTAIMGIVGIEATYDNYVEDLKSMGMEEAITIQNAALQRYYER